ncbi:hypothetical protein CRBSH125_06470 [Afipia carboxidovorans]|nr:hypothetical protein CRBSH125_06470 [Afipia carboxidovorans]
MIEIGDNPLADAADAGRQQRKTAGRHIDGLTGIFAPIRQHIAAEQVNPHPLEATTLFSLRLKFSLNQRHETPGTR